MSKLILLACHCKHGHKEVYLFGEGLNGVPASTYPGVEYVNIHCEVPQNNKTHVSWDDFSVNSMDYVIAVGCPLYPVLLNPDNQHPEFINNMLEDLLIYGWDILKPGGRIVIRLAKELGTLPVEEKLKQNILGFYKKLKKSTPPSWKIYLNNGSDIITYNDPSINTQAWLVLEKKRVGGRRKTRKTRRRRTYRK